MIPKKIHYCWFGRGKKDKLFDQCLKSWKKYFPDYEIIEWNEDNFDINYNDYVKEAYEAKKYAFVSDVARLKILYDQGGIYFDTDVEVIKRFPDEVLEKGYFAEEDRGVIATGLGVSAPAGNMAIKAMLDDYRNLHFLQEDGSFDSMPCPGRNSKALIKVGYKIEAGKKIAGIPVYDNRVFCGYDYVNHHYAVSDETLSVHHYAGSWETKGRRRINGLKKEISYLIGLNNYKKMRDFVKGLKKNPKDELRKHTDLLFFVGYFCFLANQTLWTITGLRPILPYLDVVGAIFLISFILINIKSYRFRDFAIVGLLAIIFGIVAWKSHDKSLLKLLGVLMAFKGVDFRRFIRNDFAMRLIMSLTVVLLSFCGLTETKDVMRGDVVRQSFGFQHPNMFGFYSFVLSLESAYLFRRKVIPIVFVGVLFLVNYFLADSRTAAVAILLLFVYLLIPNRLSRVIVKNFPVKQVFICSFLVFFAFSVFMTLNWTTAKVDWVFQLNKALNNRFYFTRLVSEEYPMNSLFGNYFEKRTGYKMAPSMSSVMTVDNGYMYSLIFLGMIATVVLAFLYTFTFIRLYKTNNYTLIAIMFLICLYIVTEGKIADVGVNPFLLLFCSVLFGNWNDLERGDAAKLMKRSKRNRKRALLVSQVNTNDYGRLLQIFCLKRTIEDFSEKTQKNMRLQRVEVLNYDIIEDASVRLRQRTKKRRLTKKGIKLWALKMILWPNRRMRNWRLNRFRRRRLSLYPVDPIRKCDDLKYVDKFELYITGSDQVWGADRKCKVNTLDWAKPPGKKVSYAAQIGRGSLKERDLKRYQVLGKFAMLSAEEGSYALTQISSVTNQIFYEVINPIALYGRDALLKHCRVSRRGDYCLCYLTSSSSKHRQYASKYAKYNHLRLRFVLGMNDEQLVKDEKLLSSGVWSMNPIKLIGEVYNSKLIITDSFDVVVLSVLLHRDFVAFCRKNMDDLESSRMFSFLDKIGLGEKFNKVPIDEKAAKISDAKWAEVDKVIEKMREESFAYLQDMLKYKEETKVLPEVTQNDEKESRVWTKIDVVQK